MPLNGNKNENYILFKNTKKNSKYNLKTRKFSSQLSIIVFILLIFFQSFSTIESCSSFKKESKIRIRRNGYTNIMIGIEEGVEESRELIERIKETFKQASEFLFSITKYLNVQFSLLKIFKDVHFNSTGRGFTLEILQ